MRSSSYYGILNYCAHQAKIEKRSRRDLYEGSKLLDAHRKQVNMLPILLIRILMIVCTANVRGDVYEGKKGLNIPSCICFQFPKL